MTNQKQSENLIKKRKPAGENAIVANSNKPANNNKPAKNNRKTPADKKPAEPRKPIIITKNVDKK